MASFKTHIAFSSLLGAGYGSAAHVIYDVPLPTCILAGGLCSVSGMLPDIDSGPGVPLRESMVFAAAVVPMMMVDRFEQFGMSPEMVILIGAGIYLFVRFVLAALLRLRRPGNSHIRCSQRAGLDAAALPPEDPAGNREDGDPSN